MEHNSAPDAAHLLALRAEGGSLDAGTNAAGAGLAGLFEPPRAIMFQGSFEEAKAAALKKSQWLVRLAAEVLCTVVPNTPTTSH